MKRTNLNIDLIHNEVLLSILSKEYYTVSVLEIMNSLRDKNICYITLNKTSADLERSFRSNKISTENLFFIDAVSSGLGKDKEEDNKMYISSPAALTELSIVIGETVKTSSFDVIVFDSLSTLNVYDLGSSAQAFTSHIINKVKAEQKKGLFLCLEDDVNTELIKNSFLFVDGSLRFTELYDYLKKKGSNRAFTALSVLSAVFFLSFWKLITAGEYGIVGLSIADIHVVEVKEIIGSVFTPVYLLIGTLLVIAIALTVYKTRLLRPIDTALLLKIRPIKQDTRLLKDKFKNKIKHWLSKRRNRK